MNKDKLQHEQAVGEMHQRAYENSVKPFIEAKNAELFEAFKEHPTTDKDGLMLIKLQMNALTSLGDSFESFINTGHLARKQLEEENDG